MDEYWNFYAFCLLNWQKCLTFKDKNSTIPPPKLLQLYIFINVAADNLCIYAI